MSSQHEVAVVVVVVVLHFLDMLPLLNAEDCKVAGVEVAEVEVAEG